MSQENASALVDAKLLVNGSEDDSLARAALAVQNSDVGFGYAVGALTMWMQDRKIPVTGKLTVNKIRSIVVAETGMNIENDDPVMLMLLATQHPKQWDDFILALKSFKKKYESQSDLDAEHEPQEWASIAPFYWAAAMFLTGIALGGYAAWILKS